MTESSEAEFRNPYAPLPQSTPADPSAPTDASVPRPSANADTGAGERSSTRRDASSARADQPSPRRRARSLTRREEAEPQRAGTSSGGLPGGAEATATALPGDPWQDLVALGGAAPAVTRQPLWVGVFTLREVLIVILGLAQLAAGFISVSPGAYHPVVALAALWVMIIAIPAIAVIVAVVRRCWAPHLRVGMFSVDAFIAAASVSALLGWLNVMALGAVAWFGCLLAVGFVVVGLAGSLIPGLREDFTSRPAALAHPSDRPLHPRAGERAIAATDAVLISAADAVRSAVRPVRAATMFPAAGPFRHPVPRVSGTAERETSAATIDDATEVGHGLVPAFGSASADDARREDAPHDVDSMGAVASTAESPVDALAPAAGADPEPAADDDRAGSGSETPAHRGFWILVPEVRIAVDPLGRPMFPVEPSAWTLALEDRGDRLLVRSTDGRVGFLTNLTGVIRN
ncbi:hypothetical protein [Microbacterium sp. ZW T5_56]|uniref:hypothetical protein n=1 Tax=Microbacterium sp. ZW T5_56 TaxID=3378081 RepID=UPI0038549D14